MHILNSTRPSIAISGQRAKHTKIDSAYAKQLQATLDEVNGKARKHTFAASEQLMRLADHAERQLDALGLAKKRRKGASVVAVSGGTMPMAYKFSRQLTMVRIERKTTGWYLTSAEQLSGYCGSFSLTVTPEQDAEAVAALRMRYCCVRPTITNGPICNGEDGGGQTSQVA